MVEIDQSSDCSCDAGGERPECPHHGYEAVIARLADQRERVRDALTAFELTDKQAVERALAILDNKETS